MTRWAVCLTALFLLSALYMEDFFQNLVFIRVMQIDSNSYSIALQDMKHLELEAWNFWWTDAYF